MKNTKRYVILFVIWVISLVVVVEAPNIFKRKCKSCNEYSQYIASLSENRKGKLQLFEGGVVEIDNKYFYIGESSDDEFELLKKGRIIYKILDPIIDEMAKRLVIVNSLLRSMSNEDREMVLGKKAAIVFRNKEYILIASKNGAPLNTN
jgi:hypothetical protein